MTDEMGSYVRHLYFMSDLSDVFSYTLAGNLEHCEDSFFNK